MADPFAELKGIQTRRSVEAVLRAIHARHPEAERLIVTGDTAHDEQLSTYEAFSKLASLKPWRDRLRIVPGNHDDRNWMRDVFSDRIQVVDGRNVFVDTVGEWSLIGLDSHIPGKLPGELGPSQCEWLAAQLGNVGAGFVCIFVHHPPMAVHSPWLDEIRLADGRELLEIAGKHRAVRALVCGHIHQERTILGDRFPVFTTPSASVQFKPETERLEIDDLSPGYRVFRFGAGGELTSWVERVRVLVP